jgi:UDP-N-acetylmuramate--alanine ligase
MSWKERGRSGSVTPVREGVAEVGPFRLTRHIHFVAIGGIGMSGIAEVLLHLGFEVSGSDQAESANTIRLRELGARVYVGHDAAHLGDCDVVVFSSAVPATNPELVAARERQVPVVRRAEMLAELMRLKHGIAVGGSHGKTTTTSLVATVLTGAGLDPTVIVGGKLAALGGTAILGQGQYLVAEADESDGTFLRLSPTIAIVTNVDREHLDHYKDMDAVRQAFVDFMDRVPFYGHVFACLDDPELSRLLPRLRWPARTYGTHADADLRIAVEGTDATGTLVRCWYHGRELGSYRLPLYGAHNALNSGAAVSCGLELGVPFDQIARALEGFQGVGRRLEIKGEVGGVLIVDDYGHHPTELGVVLDALRANFPDRRLVVLFQPHRYTRTRDHHSEFADVLARADVVGILPIYPASEDPIVGVTSDLIVGRLRDVHGVRVRSVVDVEDACEWAAEVARSGDLWVTQGAGDIARLAEPLLARLETSCSEGD